MNSLPGNVLLIAGDRDDTVAALLMLRDAGIETVSNPDLHIRHYRQFGVDDAQELRTRASSRALGDRRVFVISASSMTSEAQNALLKTLEEPPGNALFVFLIPAPEALLATVRSRSQIIELAGSTKKSSVAAVDAREFFRATPARRIDMLKKILEKDDDDKYDTGAILSFLASLERKSAEIKDIQAKRKILEIIYRVRSYSTDRGALVKTLLESVALLAPVL